MKPFPVGLVGCGAVAEFFYAPALQSLERSGHIEVVALTDLDERRRAQLAKLFPRAQRCDNLSAALKIRLGIVATPARWHAEHATTLLNAGIGVLCEKPIAATSSEAEAMIAAAREHRAVLAVGLIRRFFPALQTIADLVSHRTFGRARRFTVREGGPFNWPAATPSFFDRAQSGGGVLLDAGVHVLDTLGWWWGEPTELEYADDAAGGVEATCRLGLAFGGGVDSVRGSVLLSRDWKTANVWTVEFEHATVRWRVGHAERLEIKPTGSAHWLVSQLETEARGGRVPADTFAQAFTRQILDVVEAVEQARAPRVDGKEALRSLRLIEQCYRERTPLVAESPS